MFYICQISLPFLLIGSMNIQASTSAVMPTTSRVPFVLHLPAQCQDNCVNTWGSYYCTCRQGYRLQADGKTCLGKLIIQRAKLRIKQIRTRWLQHFFGKIKKSDTFCLPNEKTNKQTEEVVDVNCGKCRIPHALKSC